MDKQTVSFRLPPEKVAALDALAELTGTGPNIPAE